MGYLQTSCVAQDQPRALRTTRVGRLPSIQPRTSTRDAKTDPKCIEMFSYSSTTTSPSWKYWWRDTGVDRNPPFFPFRRPSVDTQWSKPKTFEVMRQSLLLNPERDRDVVDLFPLLIGCMWSSCVWGYGGRDGLDLWVKRGIPSCKNTPSLANKTRRIQPKLIVTGIYSYPQSSLSPTRRAPLPGSPAVMLKLRRVLWTDRHLCVSLAGLRQRFAEIKTVQFEVSKSVQN